jgi:hypothetical protein
LEQSTTLLLGLPGVAVSRVERRDDGIRVVHVVTAAEHAGPVPGVRGRVDLVEGVGDDAAAGYPVRPR